MKNRFIIWQNSDLNLDDWRDDLVECLRENGIEDPSEDDLYREMEETNWTYLEDEKANLNIDLPSSILAIADLGLWYGRRSGYREMGNNLSEVVMCPHDYAEIYVDERGDIACNDIHHDGTNHIIFRMWKPEVSDCQKDNLKSKIYDGKATRRDITRVTVRLGDYAAKVYGWKIRGRRCA
ncbi:MAG: hypothetical protein IJG15_05200 [Lachnospiraceae bacterium]|nr:hypothetical protein [Lachnospiraceae bacterium]